MQTLVANIGYAVSEWMLETPATVVYEQVHGCPNTNLRMARDNGSRRTGVVLLCMGVGGVGMHSVTARSFVDSAIRRGFRCFALDMHTSKHTPAEWAEDDELHRVVMFLAQTHPRLPLFAVGHSCGALRLTTLCIRKTTPIRAICCMAHPLELRRAIHMIRRHPGCRWWFSGGGSAVVVQWCWFRGGGSVVFQWLWLRWWWWSWWWWFNGGGRWWRMVLVVVVMVVQWCFSGG